MAKNLKLRDLKKKTPQELLVYAEELGVENASSMRTQDMLFEILKTLASDNKDIDGEGVLEVTGWFWIFKINGSQLSSRS